MRCTLLNQAFLDVLMVAGLFVVGNTINYYYNDCVKLLVLLKVYLNDIERHTIDNLSKVQQEK